MKDELKSAVAEAMATRVNHRRKYGGAGLPAVAVAAKVVKPS